MYKKNQIVVRHSLDPDSDFWLDPDSMNVCLFLKGVDRGENRGKIS